MKGHAHESCYPKTSSSRSTRHLGKPQSTPRRHNGSYARGALNFTFGILVQRTLFLPFPNSPSSPCSHTSKRPYSNTTLLLKASASDTGRRTDRLHGHTGKAERLVFPSVRRLLSRRSPGCDRHTDSSGISHSLEATLPFRPLLHPWWPPRV